MSPSTLLLLLVSCWSTTALRVDQSLLRMGPAPAIAKPKTITRQKTGGGGPGGGGGTPTVQIAKPKLKRVVEDVPMWKVHLLGDEEYEEDPVSRFPHPRCNHVVFSRIFFCRNLPFQVCTVLKQVVPDIENDRQAAERYKEAMLHGKSLLVVAPKEHAEAYVEQLARADPEMIVFAEATEE